MTYDKYTCPVDHPGLRRDFIGSSDAAAIMGVSPWDTPFSLWEKTLGLRPSKELNCAMAYGIENESKVRKILEEEMGIKLPSARVFSDQFPFLMANFDGLCGDYAIEIKSPGKEDHDLALQGKIPEKYFPQLQHLMLVAGLKEITYVSSKNNEIVKVNVKQDKKYQKELLQKEKEFHDMRVNFIEPQKTDRDYVKRSDISWRNLAHRYKTLKEWHEQVDSELAEVKQELIYLSQGNSSEGAGIKLIKSNRKGNIDYTKIPELEEIDLEKYRKPSIETWRII